VTLGALVFEIQPGREQNKNPGLPNARLSGKARAPPPRSQRSAGLVTRPLAESLIQLAELIEPAAEAADEWLECRDSEDPRGSQTKGAASGKLAAVPEVPS
jgi:hypothetical protein